MSEEFGIQQQFEAWAQEYSEVKEGVALTEEESALMWQLLRNYEKKWEAKTDIDAFAGVIEEEDSMVKLIRLRFKYIGMKISLAASIFVAQISEGVPGNAVIYVYLLSYLAKTAGLSKLDLNFIQLWISSGLPSKAWLSKAWDGQKVSGMNLLDHVGAEHLALVNSNVSMNRKIL